MIIMGTPSLTSPKSKPMIVIHDISNYCMSKRIPTKKRGDMYLVFHCIHTSMPISEICRHNVIENLLCKVNTCLTIHHWQGNETNIGTLGFFVNIDPANYLHNKIKEHLHQKILLRKKHNHIDKKKILLFKCGYSSPFVIDSEGYQTLIKAYNIQCCYQDAPQTIKYLRRAYLSSPMFVFHKLQHQDFMAYCNAICKQNSFLAKLLSHSHHWHIRINNVLS